MKRFFRVALCILAFTMSVRTASAGPITAVATLQWSVDELFGFDEFDFSVLGTTPGSFSNIFVLLGFDDGRTHQFQLTPDPVAAGGDLGEPYQLIPDGDPVFPIDQPFGIHDASITSATLDFTRLLYTGGGAGSVYSETALLTSPGIQTVLFASQTETAPVPEPSTMLLVGAGAAGIWRRRRRARQER